MLIRQNNDPQSVFDRHFALKCPHCATQSNISAISIPRYELLDRFRPEVVGLAYRCDSCNAPIFLRFRVERYDVGNHRIDISEEFDEVERPQETFDFEHLPDSVGADFSEALSCFSQSSCNAFAAMCRRTVQSVATDLGAAGKDKVLGQLRDLKEMAQIDDETFDLLKQIVIDGHDGAHPHLPSLNPERAVVLLELMKDVLYQLYVRKGKLQKAMALRREAIDAATEPEGDESR